MAGDTGGYLAGPVYEFASIRVGVRGSKCVCGSVLSPALVSPTRMAIHRFTAPHHYWRYTPRVCLLGGVLEIVKRPEIGDS